ncbi:MAG: hypothetical protein KH028_07200 [Oscillospiraceae bacterium]|nr:hypothetical protein [Oscillospiraceae bacterium]
MGEFEEKLNSILGDKDAMGQIMALAQSLGKPAPPASEPEDENEETGWERACTPTPEAGAGEDPLSALGSLDPRMVQMGMRLLKEYQTGDDRNTALLAALRPFLRKERYARLDRAIQIARLSRVIRVAFHSLSGKEEGEGV